MVWSLREPALESECVYGMGRHFEWVHSLKIPARSRHLPDQLAVNPISCLLSSTKLCQERPRDHS